MTEDRILQGNKGGSECEGYILERCREDRGNEANRTKVMRK